VWKEKRDEKKVHPCCKRNVLSNKTVWSKTPAILDMTINKITILLLIIACNTSLSFSQDYLKDTTIISLDNKEVRMTINIDLPSENLIISLNSLEKLCFRNCKSWPQINVLGDHNFLELEYSTLGGTSIEIKNTVIVCVANNKLYNVLYCQSLLSEDGYYDKREYQVKFLSMKRKNKYELLTQVKDYLEDKENPKENYKKMDSCFKVR